MLPQDIAESLLAVMWNWLAFYHTGLYYEGSIQMWPYCRLKIAYCYCLRMWIFGQTLCIDADQTFTTCTPLLMGHTADMGVGMTWGAGHPRSSPPAPCRCCCHRLEWCYVMLLCVLDSAVKWWHPVADWPSIGAFQAASIDRPCGNCVFGVSCWAGHTWDLLSCAISSNLCLPR